MFGKIRKRYHNIENESGRFEYFRTVFIPTHIREQLVVVLCKYIKASPSCMPMRCEEVSCNDSLCCHSPPAIFRGTTAGEKEIHQTQGAGRSVRLTSSISELHGLQSSYIHIYL